MPSVSSYISSHNITTLTKSRPNAPNPMCNCNNADSCPLDGECQVSAVVYQGTIEIPNGEKRNYIGLAEPVFKGRWLDHMTSCNDRQYEKKTKLSQEFWNIRDSGQNVNRYENIKFSIKKKSHPYRAGGRKCDLYLWEKLLIMQNEKVVINKRDEFMSKCLHRNIFKLRNHKTRNR